jgi:hypothetical protein
VLEVGRRNRDQLDEQVLLEGGLEPVEQVVAIIACEEAMVHIALQRIQELIAGLLGHHRKVDLGDLAIIAPTAKRCDALLADVDTLAGQHFDRLCGRLANLVFLQNATHGPFLLSVIDDYL